MQWIPVILILPYFFFIIKIYRSLTRVKPFNTSADPVTFISLVVACHNEQDNIPLLLKCIGEQDYPEKLFEIIIVDDNSTDRTYEIATGYTGCGNIIVVHNNGKGKKEAIRTGISSSSGSLIITTDADCRMGKRWLGTIESFYQKHKPDMIICPVQIESSPGFFGKFQEMEFLSLQGITAGSAISGNGVMCNGANLSFTRKAYSDNVDNLHDEIASGDDIFLLHSLKRDNKSKILWLESAEAMVTTAASPTISAFLKQRSRWIYKAKAYSDRFTVLLGMVTFITIAVQIFVLAEVFINQLFIPVLLTIFALKSIPDLLILTNTLRRYGRNKLIIWFLPSQLIYPFYVLSTLFYPVFSRKAGLSVPHFRKEFDPH